MASPAWVVSGNTNQKNRFIVSDIWENERRKESKATLTRLPYSKNYLASGFRATA